MGFLGRNGASSLLPGLNRALPWLPAPGLRDWLAGGVGGGEQAADGAAASLSLGPREGEGKRPSGGGKREPLLPLAATGALAAPVRPASRGFLSRGLHNAGYFHPDVLCHHRPGHSVLHYLPAVALRLRRGALGTAQDEADRPGSLLCGRTGGFGLLVVISAPGLQSNQRPLISSDSPAAQQPSSRAFRVWLTTVGQGAFGAPRRRPSAGTAGARGRGWPMLCALELSRQGAEDAGPACRLLRVTLQSRSDARLDSLSLGVNAT